MLRRLFRYLTRSRGPNQQPESSAHVRLYATIEPPAKPAPGHGRMPQPLPHAISDTASHRQRLLSMQLEHVRLCSPARCEQLREFGISTTGDLARADIRKLALKFGAPHKAARTLRAYRRAIRFASSVPGMMPRDAMLLISIHRRSAGRLAAENAAMLHRDLERFAESTSGRRQLKGRRVPSVRRIKKWIHACEPANAA